MAYSGTALLFIKGFFVKVLDRVTELILTRTLKKRLQSCGCENSTRSLSKYGKANKIKMNLTKYNVRLGDVLKWLKNDRNKQRRFE
jgi:hypothetical protein